MKNSGFTYYFVRAWDFCVEDKTMFKVCEKRLLSGVFGPIGEEIKKYGNNYIRKNLIIMFLTT